MNRTDRLLAIILELQDRKHLRAQDLAAIFEVSKRTIYRDIQALMEWEFDPVDPAQEAELTPMLTGAAKMTLENLRQRVEAAND